MRRSHSSRTLAGDRERAHDDQRRHIGAPLLAEREPLSRTLRPGTIDTFSHDNSTALPRRSSRSAIVAGRRSADERIRETVESGAPGCRPRRSARRGREEPGVTA